MRMCFYRMLLGGIVVAIGFVGIIGGAHEVGIPKLC